MNLKVFIICIVAVALLAVPISAVNSTATIRGEVYSWDTFEPLENAVVEVNSTPSQSMVAKYGVYSFELEPGNYLIKASYYENSTLINSAEKSIEVKGEGSYKVDLLLLPVYSEELIDTENAESSSIQTVKSDAVNNSYVNDSSANNVSTTETSETNRGLTSSTVYYFLAALMLSLLLAGGYNFKKHKNAEKNNPENERQEKHQLETSKLDKSRLLEEKAEPETEKPFVPVTIPEFSAKKPAERVEPKTESEPSVKPAETQYSEELEFKVEKKKKQSESREEEFIPEITSTAFEQGTEEEKETCTEKPSREPGIIKMSEPETPVIKRNLPLPADLQEIMDIIRGQGGRITQKDLRSKLKYSEGKVSLMLADLERRELIEKFKRGRGNVIILRDERR